MDFSKFKPFLIDFIHYYYKDLGNVSGGYLHIVLDDGNIDDECIYHCQLDCEKHNDSFGFFLARLLREFTEDELQLLYDDNWWKMN